MGAGDRADHTALDIVALRTAAHDFGRTSALAISLFGAGGVTTDVQWSTLMDNVFSTANWPGINASSLGFVRGFFKALVNWR
jgi:hypothetical protein